jgi:hypothetical protein
MNVTCPVCGRQVGKYDLCKHYQKRICLGCCRDTNHAAEQPAPEQPEAS